MKEVHARIYLSLFSKRTACGLPIPDHPGVPAPLVTIVWTSVTCIACVNAERERAGRPPLRSV